MAPRRRGNGLSRPLPPRSSSGPRALSPRKMSPSGSGGMEEIAHGHRTRERGVQRLRARTRLRKKSAAQTRWQPHPLLYLGVGMLTMLLLWVVLSAAVGWAITTLDTLHYGYPRTFQTDARVGHNEQAGQPSHFIAINLKGRIEVIELPGGDASHARIYLGPQLYGPNNDLVPVTLSFVDVNGDHKPDMLINFQGSQVVFINDGQGFRPLQPSERNQVQQFLQHLGR